MTHFANFMLYQLGWFACVVGTARGFQPVGVGLACGFLILHFLLAADRSTQIKMSAVAAILGLAERRLGDPVGRAVRGAAVREDGFFEGEAPIELFSCRAS